MEAKLAPGTILIVLAVLALVLAGCTPLRPEKDKKDVLNIESSGCEHTIGPKVLKANGFENFAAVAPGDTVCIEARVRPALKLFNFQGEPGNPIVFVNSGGPVIIQGRSDDYAGITIQNSEHIRLTGTGVSEKCGASYPPDEQQCGYVIIGSGRGVAGTDRTGHIEIDHVEVQGSHNVGIKVKSDEEEGVTRNDWVQYHTYLHHNYLHNIGTEGFYIGSSYYDEGLDPVLEGVDISYNLIRRTGWDGLQVGSAVKDCVIHHNRIIEASQANNPSQQSGIMNNRGSVCDIYNNYIVDSVGRGIYVQGNGGNQIYNNVIIRPGRLESDKGDGIVVTRGSNKGQNVFIGNNTIIEPKRSGIRFRNDQGDENLIQNNIIVAPGTLARDGGVAYIDIRGLTNVIASGNLLAPAVTQVRFSNAEAGDYSLLSASPTVNIGADLTGEETTFPNFEAAIKQ